MNIKISEGPTDTWNLWVTEKPGDEQPPIVTASKRTAEQILALLPVVLAVAPAPVAAAEIVEYEHGDLVAARKNGTRAALALMRTTLHKWIAAARENHEAMGHRGENRGEECWRSYAPDDIRSMINQVAAEYDISGFSAPTNPPED